MVKLTKEQIEKLSAEEQENLALVELRLARKRQELLQQARGYRGYLLMPVIVGIIGACLFFSHTEHQYDLSWYSFLFLFALIQVHAIGMNRRLDALLELHEPDRKPSSQSERSDDQS